MDVLTIGGTVMPKVSALTITREPIWSKNTGRCANGKMAGDIIAFKFKLQVTFAPLSDESAAVLAAATRPAFFSVKFKDPESGSMTTKTMYAGSLPYPVYSYVGGVPRYTGTAVDLVEQ